MEMSVKAGDSEHAASRTTAATSRHGANASDLDIWLQKAEALGELKRITAEVDPDLEAATITYLVGSEKARRCCSRTSRAIPATRRSTT